MINKVRNEFKGDFLGFTFDGYHSSVLGMVRTSTSDRYEDNLLPTIQDKTVQIPGGNGTYFFGSYYTQKPFNISVAFDMVSEYQLNRIRQIFGDQKVHDIIFDEAPYKVYSVKCSGTPQFKALCFDEYVTSNGKEELQRVYKGEGTFSFVAYYPYARSRFQSLDEVIDFEEKDIDGNITKISKTPRQYFGQKGYNIDENWNLGRFKYGGLVTINRELGFSSMSGGTLAILNGDNYIRKITLEKTSNFTKDEVITIWFYVFNEKKEKVGKQMSINFKKVSSSGHLPIDVSFKKLEINFEYEKVKSIIAILPTYPANVEYTLYPDETTEYEFDFHEPTTISPQSLFRVQVTNATWETMKGSIDVIDIRAFDNEDNVENINEILAGDIKNTNPYKGFVYNGGDLECPFEYYFSFEAFNYSFKISCGDKYLVLNPISPEDFEKYSDEVYLRINTKNRLIEGLDGDYNLTGNVFNYLINEGDFFDLPVGKSEFIVQAQNKIQNVDSYGHNYPTENKLVHKYLYY